MLIILTHQPYCPVPESADIDELYPGRREGTDYSLPKPTVFVEGDVLEVVGAD